MDSTLSLGVATLSEAGEYDVIVSNDCGVTTAASTVIEVAAAPVIIGAIGTPDVDQSFTFALETVRQLCLTLSLDAVATGRWQARPVA